MLGGLLAPAQSIQVLLVGRRDPQDPIRRILRDAGYPVVSAHSISAAIRGATQARPGIVVADARVLTRPDRDQLASFATEHDIPLIVGWSDHASLVTQVKRVLDSLQSQGEEPQWLVAGSLQVNLATHVASVSGRPLDLTTREFELLAHLGRHPGWIYSRQELMEQVWGYEYGDPRVVTVHIANLRRKAEAVAPGVQLIETVRNAGYRLVAPAESEPVRAASPALTPEVHPPESDRRQLMFLKSCMFRLELQSLYIADFLALKSPELDFTRIKAASLAELGQMREQADHVEYQSPEAMEAVIDEYVQVEDVWRGFVNMAMNKGFDDIFQDMLSVLHFIGDVKTFRALNPGKLYAEAAVSDPASMERVTRVLGDGIRKYLDYAIELKEKQPELFDQVVGDYELLAKNRG